MQGLLCVTFLISTVLGTVFGLGDSTCKEIRLMKNFQEHRIMGHWVTYGGNLKCRNCCITYDLTQPKPGQIKAIQRNYTTTGPGLKGEATKIGNKKSNAIYDFGAPGVKHFMHGDYHTYLVAYKTPDEFGLYLRSADAMDDPCTRRKLLKIFNEQAKLCGLTYTTYNVKHACRFVPKGIS